MAPNLHFDMNVRYADAPHTPFNLAITDILGYSQVK
jgi:hypothetical protein